MHNSNSNNNNKCTQSSLIRDFETFENTYFALLDKAKVKLAEFKKGGHHPRYHWDIQSKYLSMEHDLAKYLIQIYRYFIDVNIMRILFNYSVQVSDPKISQETVSIFFVKVKEIQLRISEFMKGHLRIKANYNQFADYFMDDSITVFGLKKYMIKTFTSWGMEKEFMDVIQGLLRFGKGLLPLKDILLELRRWHDITVPI